MYWWCVNACMQAATWVLAAVVGAALVGAAVVAAGGAATQVPPTAPVTPPPGAAAFNGRHTYTMPDGSEVRVAPGRPAVPLSLMDRIALVVLRAVTGVPHHLVPVVPHECRAYAPATAPVTRPPQCVT
jgi:hypothetical protein